jgi:hypothetical protein
VSTDGKNLFLIQGFPGAETLGSCGLYQTAKDSEVSAPTGAGLKSKVRPTGLLVNSASSTMRSDGRYLLFIQDFPAAETPGPFDIYREAKDPRVSAPTDAGVESCFRPPSLLLNSTSYNCGAGRPETTFDSIIGWG